MESLDARSSMYVSDLQSSTSDISSVSYEGVSGNRFWQIHRLQRWVVPCTQLAVVVIWSTSMLKSERYSCDSFSSRGFGSTTKSQFWRLKLPALFVWYTGKKLKRTAPQEWQTFEVWKTKKHSWAGCLGSNTTHWISSCLILNLVCKYKKEVLKLYIMQRNRTK